MTLYEKAKIINKKSTKFARLTNKIKNYSPSTKVQLPNWMITRIEEDILHVNFTNNKKLFQPEFMLYCSIRNSRIRFHHSPKQLLHYRLHVLKLYFKFLCTHYQLPDLDFGINYGDCVECVPPEISLPVLTFAKKNTSKGPILIPDFEMIEGYQSLDQELDQGINEVPWDEKKNMSFWRGSSTGGTYNIENYKTMPRVQLSYMSLKHSELVDARISKLVQCTEEISRKLHEEKLVGAASPIRDHLKYKYLIDIDGNSCTYSRLYWILRSNCVPLKHKSPNIQWYYGGFKNNQNICFFSLDEEPSITTQIEFLAQNDDLAYQIATESSLFCRTYLNKMYATSYILTVLDALKNQ